MLNSERQERAARLREERERLGYSHATMAHRMGMSVSGYRKYESGTHKINTDALPALKQAGIDTRYVETGVRDALPQPRLMVAETPAPYNVPDADIVGLREDMRECKERVTNMERITQNLQDVLAGRLDEVLKRFDAWRAEQEGRQAQERGTVRRGSAVRLGERKPG